MSRSRRNFSAEFKTNLVLQLLKGEKELNVLAVENDIQPNLLRNWKKEFLANASLAFDNKREDNLREKLAEERKEKAEYAKKVGQLTMQVDWLKKKNLKKLSDLTTRVNLVRNLSTTKELPVSTGAKLLGINRTSVYYSGIPVSEEELECKSIIDHLHTDNPTWGARQMSAQLKLRGYHVGRRKASRYMREMDITYIPMKHGFLYLTAIIDWYSRCIVGWDVDDTLDTTMVITALKKAFMVAKPVILNSDQGCQFDMLPSR
ncbi:MAG: DDE-type integrase/transposase/recombinase [Blautia faecis]